MPRVMPCALCRKKMYQGPTSLPEGKALCHPCRRWIRETFPKRAAQPRQPRERQPRKPRKPRKARGSTTARGYGNYHQQMRKYLISTFQPGQPCPRCQEPINTGDPVDLDHTDDRAGYIGLTHRWCNRATARQRQLPRSCPICGQELTSSPSQQRTCSRACGWEWRRQHAA
jgi:hypothetical protein